MLRAAHTHRPLVDGVSAAQPCRKVWLRGDVACYAVFIESHEPIGLRRAGPIGSGACCLPSLT